MTDQLTDESALAIRIDAAAARLRLASHESRPCRPIRDLLPAADVATAYRVQALNLGLAAAAGRLRVGRKIGLTSPAVQQKLGVDQPDFGSLLDDMAVPSGESVPVGRLLQPNVEGEVAFWLERDLAGRPGSIADLRLAIGGVSAAIEIVDSRIAEWDITIVDTVADNSAAALFVVSDRRVPLAEVDPIAVEMSLTVNGKSASSGNGKSCMGDPLRALLWLAQVSADMGDPLRAGEVVLSGALGPMVAVAPGDRVRAELSTLGSVEVAFAEEESEAG
jgi:2-keto-4-pentenoate hydratase